MEYFISNNKLDRQISEIRKRIRLSMNGITVESMKSKGVIYKQNFGVAIPVLREIAACYSPSDDLSKRLWAIGGRETMILSVLLQPLEGFTIEKALERVQNTTQKEIIDVLCLYLLSKAEYAAALSFLLIKSEKSLEKSAGFILAARTSNKFTQTEIETIIQLCLANSITDNFVLYSAIALCLGRFCRINKENANAIRQIVDNFVETLNPSQRHIANEVKLELDFFE